MLLSNAAAYGLAASWGSFIQAGDPGRWMYCFNEDFVMPDENHRRQGIAYLRNTIAAVKAAPTRFIDPIARKAELRRLIRKFHAAPVDRSAEFVKLDAFTQGYVKAGLWLVRNEEGEDLDGAVTFSHLPDGEVATMIADCAKFQADHAADLAEAVARGRDMEHLGHDLWLTSRRHGAGFWDRSELEGGGLGDRLTEAAHDYSESELYLNDNGMLFFM